jgi:predicted dinucleotide-binding enzyme
MYRTTTPGWPGVTEGIDTDDKWAARRIAVVGAEVAILAIRNAAVASFVARYRDRLADL